MKDLTKKEEDIPKEEETPKIESQASDEEQEDTCSPE